MPTTTPQTFTRLSAAQVDSVLVVVESAESEDGVRPVNEATELRLRDADARDVVHLMAGAGTSLHGYAQLSGVGSHHPEVELVVHPGHRRAGAGTALLRAAARQVGDAALRGWAHGDLPAARALASSEGFEASRGLWRMRREMSDPLPGLVVPDDVQIRAFEPGRDEDAWLRVNARAFAAHPEQGRWTTADLLARMREPWFEPAGFLLADDATTGELIGYHWTKVEGDVGEVYVVGVDPSAQGRRLGTILTLAGLRHLQQRGVDVVDLYVESDNEPALKVYSRLGFAQASVDVMYERLAEGSSAGT